MIDINCAICKGTGTSTDVQFDDHSVITPCAGCNGSGKVQIENEYDLFDLLKIEYD